MCDPALEEVFHQVVSNRTVPGAETDDENDEEEVSGEEEPMESGTSERSGEKPESEDSLDQEARSSSSEDSD